MVYIMNMPKFKKCSFYPACTLTECDCYFSQVTIPGMKVMAEELKKENPKNNKKPIPIKEWKKMLRKLLKKNH